MKTIIFSSLLAVASAICHHGTTLLPRDTAAAVPIAAFGFNGLTGPLNWHGLKPENAKCALGREQSPINVVESDPKVKTVKGKTLTFKVDNYPHGAEIENLGSTLEVFANGTLVRDGKTYALRQFHFHTPSEHRIESEYYPMEVHFVFQAADASLSVVGFMMEVSQSKHALSLFKSVFEHLEEVEHPGTAGETGPLFFGTLEKHLARSTVYQYGGSLTTPPCSEGVAWNVVKEPVYVDLKTFRAVKAVMKFNSRYTQNVPGAINLLDNARNVLDGHPSA